MAARPGEGGKGADGGGGRSGPWQGRVRFSPGGGFAYRPGEVIVRSGEAELAKEALARSLRRRRIEPRNLDGRPTLRGAFTRFTDVPDVVRTLEDLRGAGIPAQPNHVLFATGCCPPHPASPQAEAFYANPFYANPFYANPFYANPFYANAGGGGCGCCCGGTGANPFYANPFYANPFYANADPSPFTGNSVGSGGRRRSSARPADEPDLDGYDPDGGQGAGGEVRVAILDTGWAQSFPPEAHLDAISKHAHGGDHPDEAGDGYLDPAAGHGTFIAGVIEQVAPGCELELFAPLSSYGDGDEDEIAGILDDLAQREDDERPHLVNLSFGGYSPFGMDELAHAVAELRRQGTIVVASAGNDGTCMPMYPAALPEVVSVGAIDDEGHPAPFTNYGPWVRACALGVDVVSIFFDGFDGDEPAVDGVDEDDFHGWAVWSGTSFAAPRVVAALARALQDGDAPEDALHALIDDEDLERRPMLGTVVD